MTTKIDFDNLRFEFQPTKAMYVSTCKAGGKWDKGRYVPFADIRISPAAGVLNYGQGLFEGLKALRTAGGKIVLFRPIENGRRVNEGARRVCMPELPEEKFVEAIKGLVRRNREYVPPYGKGALYIRPCMWGTGPVLGVAVSPEYTFVAFTCPVGPYYKGGMTPIKVEFTDQFHRAAPRGTGHVKTVCNYAGTLYPSKQAKAKGYADAAYLDAREETYIEEVGGANFFMLNGKTLSTPKLGSILPGITRRSVMTIAAEILRLKVVERHITLREALKADECFCTGTAAVVSPIGLIAYKGRETVIGGEFKVGAVTSRLYSLLTKIQLQEEKDRWGWVVEV